MRTYRVRGKTYKPTYVGVNDTMRGISSWYGPNFHGKQTSNGEWYDMHGMTAAHKTWPMDTMVRVDNLKNGKSVVVRINDRGPFVSGRIIDCSYAAGKAIGLDKSGIAPVKLTVLGFAGKVYHATKPTVQQSSAGTPAPALPRVQLSDFGIQVGAFRRRAGAEVYRSKYQAMDSSKQVMIKEFVVEGAPLYRVFVMGFGTDSEAKDFISEHNIQGGFLIRK
jgi:rare lipoprotein A